MNIVITKNNGAASASLTQYNSSLSYLITDIKVCVHNDISDPVITFVSTQGFEYTCNLIEGISIGTAFKAYSLQPIQVMPEDDYTVRIQVGDKFIQVSSIIHIKLSAAPVQSDGIFDEHNYLLVNGRTIQVIADQVTLLAEDENSQEIRFKIRNRYDNVSFLTDKTIVVDFIPAEWDAIKEEIIEKGISVEGFDPEAEFISGPITKTYEDPQSPDYMILCWTVPLVATQRAGVLRIALAIIDEQSSYVWQTSPATLIVQPNIGKRNKCAAVSLESPIVKIENRVEALENLFNGSATVVLEEGE